jgi:class 3 adenylate cyclase
MEAAGEPDQVHVSEAYRRTVAGQFEFADRGLRDLRGIGSVRTFFLLRERPY